MFIDPSPLQLLSSVLFGHNRKIMVLNLIS